MLRVEGRPRLRNIAVVVVGLLAVGLAFAVAAPSASIFASGDCLRGYLEENRAKLDLVDCSEQHDFRVEKILDDGPCGGSLWAVPFSGEGPQNLGAGVWCLRKVVPAA